MNFPRLILLVGAFALTACGGGGGGSNPPPAASAPPTGGITITAGDHHLDGIEAVIIDIEEVVLIGGGEQQELIARDIGPIDLLTLRNVTEVIAAAEVPARTYSKIRLIIRSLEIVEVGNPVPIEARRPANGKIDLVPQGTFEISPGEDLVVQIDFDLERSVHLVLTGSHRYQFRPVVFVDIIDQTEYLRLVHLFGTVEDDVVDSLPSDFDLCDVAVPDDCYDVNLGTGPIMLLADGTPAPLADLPRGDTAHVFGHFFLDLDGDEMFRALAIVMAPEEGLAQINGEVQSELVAGAFDLLEPEAMDPTSVELADGAPVLDGLGLPLEVAIAAGQEAEAWAQQAVLDLADPGTFPAFLVQVTIPDEEESLAGTLVDISDGTLEITNDDGVFCIDTDEETEIQLLEGFEEDAEASVVSLQELADRIGEGIEVEAFGMPTEGCFHANFIAAEIESAP